MAETGVGQVEDQGAMEKVKSIGDINILFKLVLKSMS